MLTAALRYGLHVGWPVFPLHSIRDGHCTCPDGERCTSPGKHPRVKNGHLNATVSEGMIRNWWTRWPDANIGVPTGRVSGLLVVDVDPRHGGDESLHALLQEFGPFPKTAEQLTGGGGRHIVFRYPDVGTVPSRIGFRDGIDIKCDGGYIVVPPSSHISGRRYTWQ